MNIFELDLDLDGLQVMLRAESRQRAWERDRREAHPQPPATMREARRPGTEPAWE
jgi:hypothetical protein